MAGVVRRPFLIAHYAGSEMFVWRPFSLRRKLLDSRGCIGHTLCVSLFCTCHFRNGLRSDKYLANSIKNTQMCVWMFIRNGP